MDQVACLAFRRPLLVSILTAELMFAPMAYANAAAPFTFWPRTINIGIAIALSASLLAAFLERPFLSMAGVQRNTLWLSLQANLVSLVVSIPSIPIAMDGYDTIAFLMWPILVGLSVTVEWSYLSLVGRAGKRSIAWGPIVTGNMLSAGIMFILITLASGLVQGPLYWDYVVLYVDDLVRCTIPVNLGMFGLGFLIPIGRYLLVRKASAGLEGRAEQVFPTVQSER